MKAKTSKPALNKGLYYPPRNYWKADVRREGDYFVKDFSRHPFFARLYGLHCLKREAAVLKGLADVPGVPSFKEMTTPYTLKMKAVPGKPLDQCKEEIPDEHFLESLTSLFKKIHDKGVAHGDAHFRNILVYKNEPYLIDFSTAYVRGTLPVFDNYIFNCYKLLDLERLYKTEKNIYGTGNSPKMFFLYRIINGGEKMKSIPKKVGLLMAVLFLILFARPIAFSLVAGGLVVFMGEAIRVWSAGHLIRNNELTTSGPYAYMRDPFYLGRLFLLIGFCLMSWGYNWILLIIGLGVFFFDYMPRKHRKEMARLQEIFGEEYTNYSSYARSLLPRIRPYPNAQKRRWSRDLFWNENREQYLLLFVLVVTLVIFFRYFFT